MNKRVRRKVFVRCVQIMKVNQGIKRRDNRKQGNEGEKEGGNERKRKGGREGRREFIYLFSLQ